MVHKITNFFTQWPRVSDTKYWFRAHTYNRYHIINLSKAEPENPDGYTWGWRESAELLLLANFKLLRDFVECTEPVVPTINNTDDSYLEFRTLKYNECMELYNWWVKERFVEYDKFNQEQDRAYAIYKSNRSEENEKIWFEAGQARWNREQEMLRRLIDIRDYLYS